MTRPVVGGITVAAVVRAMGVKRQREVSWAVGRLAAQLWRDRTGGVDPAVQLVPKSAGGGTHHMAVYPRRFRPTIERLVKLAALGQGEPVKRAVPRASKPRARQRDLFAGAR